MALANPIKTRIPKGEVGIVPGAKIILAPDGSEAYSSFDRMFLFELRVRGELIIKNNSQRYGYNLQLINSNDVFSACKKIPMQTSLAPNESIKLEVDFNQFLETNNGSETDNLPDVPKNKQKTYLIATYENESGKKFTTKFVPSFKESVNEYWF
jgi:hypothetical protein